MGRVNVGGMGDQGAVAGSVSDRVEVEPVAVVAGRSAAVGESLLHFYNIGLGLILTGSGVVGIVGCLADLHCGPGAQDTAASGFRGMTAVNWL
jgi:hypothetical protein